MSKPFTMSFTLPALRSAAATQRTSRWEMRRKTRRRLPRLWLMTDSTRMTLEILRAAVLRLPHGSGVIIRHPEARQRLLWAQAIAPICRMRRLFMTIAGDWRTAAALRCDGLHAPEAMTGRGLPPGARLWHGNGRRMLTAAAHSARAIHMAGRAGAQAALVAPVLPTASHPGRGALGRFRFAALVKDAKIAVIALGGITPATIRQLNGIGFYGVAGVGLGQL